jgi:hypothetical protein
VLAPEDVSAWVPAFRDHAYPVVARAHYTQALLAVFANSVDTRNLQERLTLAAYLNDTSADDDLSSALLARWLEANMIAAVAVPLNHSRITEITRVLDEAGFESSEYSGYLIFQR